MLASGIALIIVLIVLVVIATGNSRGDKLSGQELIDLPLAYKKDVRLAPSDFIIPNPEILPENPMYYLSRKQMSRWMPEQINKFWPDTKAILIDLLSAKNEKALAEILEKIP